MSSIPEFDFTTLAEQAQRVQEDTAKALERLEQSQATGDDGTRAVTATVGGGGKVLALRIDPSVIDPTRPTELADLVVAATNNALDALKDLHAQSIAAITDQIGGLLDGLDEQAHGTAYRP